MIEIDFTMITEKNGLAELIDEFKTADFVAMDTEADSMHHYHHRLCLLQFSVNHKHFLLDPMIPDFKLKSLWKALQSKLLLFHGADYDLRMLYQHYKFSPKRIHDTMLAGQLLGEPKLGLTNLVQKYFGFALAKSNQKADWTRRPLPEEMLQYAALDTYFLPELYAQQVALLQQLDRLQWLEETQNLLLQHTKKLPEPVVDPWRIKGSTGMNSKELAVLQSAWHWREQTAEKWDRPPFKVLSPQLLLECVERVARARKPENRAVKLPKLPRNFKPENVDAFLDSLYTPLQQNPASWPKPVMPARCAQESPDSRILESIKAFRDKLAQNLNIEPTLIANRHQLVLAALNCHLPASKLQKTAELMDWQFSLLQPAILPFQS
jgi:ribonuclease D